MEYNPIIEVLNEKTNKQNLYHCVVVNKFRTVN